MANYREEKYLLKFQKSIYDQFFEFAKKEWAKILSLLTTLSLFFGGLIFFLYFHSIQFTPTLDVGSSVSILIAAAILGVFILSIFSSLLVLPGLTWFLLINSNHQFEQKKSSAPFIFASWFIFPYIFVFSFLLACRRSYIDIDAIMQESNLGYVLISLSQLLLLFAGFFVAYVVSLFILQDYKYALGRSSGFLVPNLCRLLKSDPRRIGSFLSLWCLSISWGQFFSLPVLLLNISTKEGVIDRQNIFQNFVFTVLISLVCNILVLYFLNKKNGKINIIQAVIVPIVGISLWIFPLRGMNFIPSLVMNRFGWGNIN